MKAKWFNGKSVDLKFGFGCRYLTSCCFLRQETLFRHETLVRGSGGGGYSRNTLSPLHATRSTGVHRYLFRLVARLPPLYLLSASFPLNTVNSPLTDTLVSGQLYLRAPFQILVLPPSQTLYLHIRLSGHSFVSGRGHF